VIDSGHGLNMGVVIYGTDFTALLSASELYAAHPAPGIHTVERQKQSWASPIFFGPCARGRTWGTADSRFKCNISDN
jgi:hypothetical protein